jgi:Protein of unknown function (DUF2752)
MACTWRGRWHSHGEPLWHALLRVLTAALLVVYVGWQLFWLAQGRLPPALFLALTGLPAPTTGGTRSMRALFTGDWQAAVRYNPLALPMTLLFVASVAWLLTCGMTRGRWRLPRQFLVAWLALLAVAWVFKLGQYAFLGAEQAL